MKIVEITKIFNAQYGVVLEENASSLIKGPYGNSTEGYHSYWHLI